MRVGLQIGECEMRGGVREGTQVAATEAAFAGEPTPRSRRLISTFLSTNLGAFLQGAPISAPSAILTLIETLISRDTILIERDLFVIRDG